MIIFAKICISIHYTDFILQNVQPAVLSNSLLEALDRIWELRHIIPDPCKPNDVVCPYLLDFALANAFIRVHPNRLRYLHSNGDMNSLAFFLLIHCNNY